MTQICRSSTRKSKYLLFNQEKWHMQDLNQQPFTFKAADALNH